ncbi:MAG: glutamate synthase large subunit [Actinobacteria bacterium]|nr:MAG: glutamate synthase large subunit [Actinomycetota bacterium]
MRFYPPAEGLYDPRFEHDACGVSFVADLRGRRSHRIVELGLSALCNLDHRGALGADTGTGDGAGILIQVPDRFFRAVVDFELPPAGYYATGIAFLPQDEHEARQAIAQVEKIVKSEGLDVLGWREVPIDASVLGKGSSTTMPNFAQVFITGADLSGLALDRRLYPIRKRIEHEIHLKAGVDESNEVMGGMSTAHDGVYFPSLSARTFVYKGMLTTQQLLPFFPDLTDERIESAIALVHSRFSTNTFPTWPLAHPYRFIAHNGEINTVQANRNWMSARESLLATDLIPGDLSRLFPICTPGGSDTMSFDEAVELLHMGGYSLPEAVLMMIPEPWENNDLLAPERRAYYQFHASLMEPWDGPASIAFTDGTIIGAVLDRNGLRPSRYWVTDDNLVIMASEVGVVDVPQSSIVEKGRLQPGRVFLIDTSKGRIIRDDELKTGLCSERPYREWLDRNLVNLHDLPPRTVTRREEGSLLQRQQVFGYTLEELKVLLMPMATMGKEALGSMGTDTALAVLSNRSRMLYDYFTQQFAQVTNPPLDAIREELVTAVGCSIGPEGNLFAPGPQSCRQIFVRDPVLDNDELAQLIGIDGDGGLSDFRTQVVPCLYPVDQGGKGLQRALEAVRARVSQAINEGYKIVVLSDRGSTTALAPIPMLLATAAVHHHLLRAKTRTRVGLVVETGEAREVHHFCLLLGFGAAAINPYLAFETIDQLIDDGLHQIPADLDKKSAHKKFIKAASGGVLKVMSKMGISTVQSYTGSQIFEAIGIGKDVIDEYFTGCVSRIGGVGLDALASEIEIRHDLAHPKNPTERAHRDLWYGGEYQWRREGEYHLFNPETVFKLQHATRAARYDIFKQYTKLVDDQAAHLATLRGLFSFKVDGRTPVPIDEVEPVDQIVKRFNTGAMSYGSISKEAHETLAIAMNRLGGRSNTGEGGEDNDRYLPDPNGDLRRSAIKQVASGRFGVTSEYLVNADDLQIKMAQGAKPGEGGQLPGTKVYPWTAKTRHSTPGVGLISPPPHHDIYSIEDLKQLIHDLKNSNPRARVHVKLVAEVGVGTVAAGVSKAHADVVLISGHDGGTGASPLTSIKHAGVPWELGLAETQQTLLMNGLRDRIVVQVDGQLKTGRDVVIAALLGAEEFGFATAPLVVSGCVMMRVCHLDTCPVGVATQNPELRKRFTGKPEFVVNFMEYIAQEVREYLAALGFRSIREVIGHAELIDVDKAIEHWKASGLDLTPILHVPQSQWEQSPYQSIAQDHGLDRALDNTLISLARSAIDEGTPVTIDLPIRNVNRTTGTMLGSMLTRKWGGAGLPDDTIQINFTGSAGQSFAAFVPKGITMRLVGDANDYFGKGLSGGHVVLRPPFDAKFIAEDNIIAGNVILYGATSGECYIRGVVGERFCVRNSGATAVVEGVGDHGCEYMTGGRAVILGPTGRNFAAGMSGGIAYVHDPDRTFRRKVNFEMVDLDVPDDDDLEWLRECIHRHTQETGSAVGNRILALWHQEKDLFVKVMPQDYKRVLVAQNKARESGQDELEAIMAAAHG